jgi:hypothetical protein
LYDISNEIHNENASPRMYENTLHFTWKLDKSANMKDAINDERARTLKSILDVLKNNDIKYDVKELKDGCTDIIFKCYSDIIHNKVLPALTKIYQFYFYKHFDLYSEDSSLDKYFSSLPDVEDDQPVKTIKTNSKDNSKDKESWWNENYQELIDYAGDLGRNDWMDILDEDEEIVDATMEDSVKHRAQLLLDMNDIEELNDMIGLNESVLSDMHEHWVQVCFESDEESPKNKKILDSIKQIFKDNKIDTEEDYELSDFSATNIVFICKSDVVRDVVIKNLLPLQKKYSGKDGVSIELYSEDLKLNEYFANLTMNENLDTQKPGPAVTSPTLQVGKTYKCFDMENNGKLVYSSITLKDIKDGMYQFYATNRAKDNEVEIPVHNHYNFFETNPLKTK